MMTAIDYMHLNDLQLESSIAVLVATIVSIAIIDRCLY